MSEESEERWSRAMQAARARDYEAIREDYPYFVERLSYRSLQLDIGNWVAENIGIDMIVVSKKLQNPSDYFTPSIITYAFRHESDAVTFKLRFGTSDL